MSCVAARYGLIEAANGSRWARPKPWFARESDGALTLHGVPVPPDPLPLSAFDPAELAHVPVAAERHAQVEVYEGDDDKTQHTLAEVDAILHADRMELRSSSLSGFERPAGKRLLFAEEPRQRALSQQRNVREQSYFPGFFTALYRKAEA